MRLEARVTLWLLALLGAAAAVTLGGLAWFQAQSLERQSQEAGYMVARSVENTLEVSMLHNARGDVQSAVSNVQRGTYIEDVAVYGRNGTPWVTSDGVTALAAAERAALARAIATGQQQSSQDGGTLSVFVPVPNQTLCQSCHHDQGPVLGAVGVTLDEGAALGDLVRSTRNSLLLAALPLLVGLVASLWAVRRNVLRPLVMVGNASERIAEGDLSARLPSFGSGEFESVSSAFNDMAGRLERHSEDLTHTVEQLRSDLEGMEEIQTLVVSGAGLPQILARTAGHLGPALGACGVGVWRGGSQEPEASWGSCLPPKDAVAEQQDGEIRTSAGPLASVSDGTKVSWAVVPAARGGRTLALMGAAWDPPRPLGTAERDLLISLAGLVAVAVENTELLDRLKGEEETLEVVLKKTFTAQEDERRRIARELHDDTSQVLHALMMNIDLLEQQLDAPPESKKKLRAAKSLAEQAGRNLDKVLFALRPALLDELGLFPALRWYAAQLREAFDKPIEFETESPRRLPEHIEVAAFRIAQEALSNAAQHSHADHIWAKVSAAGGTLVVDVRDDGCGFDTKEAAGRARSGQAVGLLGMRERAELLGGRISVESRPGEGTQILAEIPLPDAAGPEAAGPEAMRPPAEGDEQGGTS